MTDERVRISVFFPMYNEEENLCPSVSRATQVLRDLVGEAYEILIVNDASTDRTGERAEGLVAADPHVRVIHHPTNLSLGGAIRTGLSASRGEVVVYTDGDLPCDIGCLREALPLLEWCEVVVGSRQGRRESALRWLYSWGYNGLVRCLFRVRVKDINFAFKVFRREVAQRLTLTSNSGFIDAEILAETVRLGYSIAELPIIYTPRVAGVSTLARPSAIVRILRDMYSYLRARYHTEVG